MTVKELIEINQFITDMTIEVRVDGNALLDCLHIGLDYGVEPPYPTMVPKSEKYIGSQSQSTKRKATYIRKSINAWDDGRDFWEIKINRIPQRWLDLTVYDWRCSHVYLRRHPRSEGNPSRSYEGIRIIALPDGAGPIIDPVTPTKHSTIDNQQITLFDTKGDTK